MAVEKTLKILVESVRWLIVAGIAYTLAVTIWMFFATPVSAPSTQQQADHGSGITRAPFSLNWILEKNLFGAADSEEAPPPPTTAAAERTRLPLELQSVFVAAEQDHSAAIVAERGKPGKLYKVGDKLPGSATLETVEHDRIILIRAGTREALPFPQSESKFAADPVAYTDEEEDNYSDDYDETQDPYVSEVLPEDAAGDTTDSADDLREQFAEDAAATLEELGIEVGDEGGYKIGDLSNAPFLRQTGLQPGDVILSINGRPVGDIEQDQLEVDNIVAQGAARVEIQRGSRRFFITAPIPSGP